MAKSKAARAHRSSAVDKAGGAGRKLPAASQPRAATYEQCMKAYRSASKRYRKTLDALAK